MNRREFLGASAVGLLGRPGPSGVPGSILVHEHVLVDFVGADAVSPERYDQDEVFRVALPKLEEVKRLGCRRLLECTPQYLGRDPQLLRRLEQAAGIELWTNTGIYGAGDHKYVPEFARRESAEELSRRFVREVEQGVEGVPPRFIKTGVNRAPLNELDRKLIRAAALTSRRTGLTVASHTADGKGALEQLRILAEEGVPPERFVWVHAQSERDHSFHRRVSAQGAWVEFDGVGEDTVAWHLDCVRFMAAEGFLDRVLVSHDAGWYHVGEPMGGSFRGYTDVYTRFVPRLEPTWVERLLVRNPGVAFPG